MVCESGQTAPDHATIAMLIHQMVVRRTQVHTARHPATAKRNWNWKSSEIRRKRQGEGEGDGWRVEGAQQKLNSKVGDIDEKTWSLMRRRRDETSTNVLLHFVRISTQRKPTSSFFSVSGSRYAHFFAIIISRTSFLLRPNWWGEIAYISYAMLCI